MQKTTQVITTFFSTTQDEGFIERRATYDRTVSMIEQAHNVAIKTLDWRENIPGGISAKRGQDRINEEVYNTFDIYLGCLGPKYGPGTVEEFEDAIDSHLRLGRPTEVLFAFDESPVNPFSLPQNFGQVIQFRKALESDDRYRRSILYFAFSDMYSFQSLLFKDLGEAVRKVKMRIKIKGGPPPAS